MFPCTWADFDSKRTTLTCLDFYLIYSEQVYAEGFYVAAEEVVELLYIIFQIIPHY